MTQYSWLVALVSDEKPDGHGYDVVKYIDPVAGDLHTRSIHVAAFHPAIANPNDEAVSTVMNDTMAALVEAEMRKVPLELDDEIPF